VALAMTAISNPFADPMQQLRAPIPDRAGRLARLHEIRDDLEREAGMRVLDPSLIMTLAKVRALLARLEGDQEIAVPR
jgi:hypothetical protein